MGIKAIEIIIKAVSALATAGLAAIKFIGLIGKLAPEHNEVDINTED